MRLCLLIFLANLAHADFAKVPATLRLISDVNAIVPGQTLTVALEIRHAPGYHTYWRNAGTVGLPTNIDWKLPDGFSAGPMLWPRPEISKMAIYTVWGYESDTLLLSDIQVPEELPLGKAATLAAEIQWMACARDCNPGFKTFSISLPVAETADVDGELRKRFDAVRRDQPAKLDAWQASAHHNGEQYRLTLQRVGKQARAVKQARFFGYQRQVSSNGEQQVEVDEDRIQLLLPREIHMHEYHERLTGLVLCPDGWLADGSHPVMAIDIPLTHGN
jgi:DsbC/DsbD-like thiol-disulfide interchange protein